MAHRRSGFSKKIDTVHWTLGTYSVGALAAGVNGEVLLGAQHLPETLLRMRGEAIVSLDGVLAPGAGTAITMGIIQVPEGQGSTVNWSPVTDADAPWIWWYAAHLAYEEYVTDVIAGNLMDARIVIDSKAMRKLRNTELQFVSENTTVPGFTAASVNVAASVRALAGS